MLSMKPADVALYDQLADWEVGHLLAELRSGRFTGTPFEVVTVAETTDPITTMGGVRMLPDMALAELDPADSALLILPGGELWDAGGGSAFAEAARRFLEAGVPVAAICGATAGLARAGLLDDAPAHERGRRVPGVHRLRGRRALRRRARGRRR